MSCDYIEQLPRDFIRIRVQEAHPAQVFDGSKFFEQQRKAVFQVEVFTIAGRVLTNESNFTRARLRQALSFGNHRFEAAGPELSAELGNDAKRARMIAALGDFDVSHVPGRGEYARCLFVV